MDRKTLKFIRALLAAGLLASTSCVPVSVTAQATAEASQNCAPRQVVVDRLAANWGESRQTYGISQDETAIVEQFANGETGTWTITVTNGAGITCLLASGGYFEILAESMPPTGAPV